MRRRGAASSQRQPSDADTAGDHPSPPTSASRSGPASSSRLHAAALAAAALGVACCSAALGGGLLYDDRALIVENQDLRPSSPWLGLIAHDYWGTPLDDPRSHTSWRPVTVASLKLNFHAHELSAAGFHVVNLGLHACVCALVVLTAHRCGVGGSATVDGTAGRQRWQPSALCGLVFAVHPVHVEAVANVAGRAELLAAVLSLATFLCFTGACLPTASNSAASPRLRRRGVRVAAAASCFLLATLAKETGFTVLGPIWAYDLLNNGGLLRRLRIIMCCCRDDGLSSGQTPRRLSVHESESEGAECEKTTGGSVSPACRDGTACWRAASRLKTDHLCCEKWRFLMDF